MLEIVHIPVAQIEADHDQPREELDRDQIESIKLSILEKGFMEENFLTVTSLGMVDDKPAYMVKNGNHRFQAVTELIAEGKFSCGAESVPSVPCFHKDFNGDEADYRLEQALDNNVKPMKTMEILHTAQMALEAGKSVVHVSRSLGIPPTQMRAELPFLSLPDNIQKALDNGNCPKAVAKEILKLFNPEKEGFKAKAVKGWTKACTDTRSADKMLAQIRNYHDEVVKSEESWIKKQEGSDGEVEEEIPVKSGKFVIADWYEKPNDKEAKPFTMKHARKYLERMEKAINAFDNTPLTSDHSQYIPRAENGNCDKIRAVSKQMTRIAKTFSESCDRFEAAK